ncbi:uncharacterized protein LOC128735987 [Sabethes cyaneus]|uniref:uncharacterized protein LOC128735987 n=1 Tax=Sabethes cyaneus TaxID=53552 RepID=UPI00237E9A6C|nr:uncharacterized protein LOC128735987 [Sabethes cyaneus]
MAKELCGECKIEINDLEPIRCGFCESGFYINQQCCGFNSRVCKELFAQGKILFICPNCRDILNGRSIASYVKELQENESSLPPLPVNLPAQVQKLTEIVEGLSRKFDGIANKPTNVKCVAGTPTNLSTTPVWPHSDRDTTNIWIYHQIVRGLRTKIDDVFLATNDCNFDVIIFTETGLDDSILSLQLFGNAFNVFRCDRSPLNSNKRSFGGVLIGVARQHPSAIFETAQGSCLEQICVRATINGMKLLLCAIYIAPDKRSDLSIIDSHVASVRDFYESSAADSTVLVCDDYNQPRIAWNYCDGIITHNGTTHLTTACAALVGMDFLNLNQANLHRNHLGRVLDLVFHSAECEVKIDLCEAPLLLVDLHHPPLAISIPANINQCAVRSEATSAMRELNYRRIDYAAFSEYISCVDWHVLLDSNDVNAMAENFCTIIRSWLNENLPFARQPFSPAWSNRRLRELKRKRNTCLRNLRRLRSTETKFNFKRSSDDYRRLNASLYNSYVLRVQTDLRRNPKKFWTFVNTKRKCRSTITDVYYDEVESCSASSSCELFAKFFSTVFASEVSPEEDVMRAAESVPADLIDLDIFEITNDMIITAAKKS